MNWRDIPDRELIELCLKGEEPAWQEFLRRFQPIILGVAYNTYRSRSRDHERADETLLEDFLHAVLDKLLASDMKALRLFNWTHENAFRAFLKVATANLVADRIRKDNAEKRDKSKEIALDPAMPIAARAESGNVDHKILLSQLARCLERNLEPSADQTRDIAIFLLYFGHRVTAMELSRVYKLNVRLVENIIAKLIRVARTSDCIGRAAAKS
jgi:RNA polymerase sigma factor (sigma-70 family)